ncbi:ABC transporter permease [Asticcacaulis sp.]|uniref:ABC transporter permease n=1 Tax=Asticcacaulis sp. TaxID=1872648 RepID=UPI003F7C6077
MRPLDAKLLRDIWRMRMHAAGIVLVLGCGLAVLIMAVGMRASLEKTRLQYYAEKHMADLAVSLVRAPDRLTPVMENAPGVAAVETRISGYALLDLPQIAEPVSARLISLPRRGHPRVNDLVLTAGRWPDPAHPEEALVNEAFATALKLKPGSSLDAILHGHRQRLVITGIANSPEFVFVTAPGEMFPQPERFAVIWMGRDALGEAYDMRGAFNDAVIRLAAGADVRAATQALDDALRAYGSAGATGRDRMMSDRFLSEELSQLGILASFIPTFFLIVAAFLVNISMGRVIATERANIGLLKAFGYSDLAIAWHYAESALIFGTLGLIAGIAAGTAYGRFIAGMYRQYYHFPNLEFSASLPTLILAAAASFAAAGLGAWNAVARAARLPPAEALAPPQPANYAQGGGLFHGFADGLDAKSRIILRRIVRFPRRAATTALGIGLAISILIVTQSFPAEMTYMLDVHFGLANRQDVTLTLSEPQEAGVLHDIERLPGVITTEPFRIDGVALSKDQRRVEEALFGLAEGATLNRLIGRDLSVIPPPAEGIWLSRPLARKLEARAGDDITIEQLRGRRIRATVRVAGIIDPMIGSSAYMELNALSRLMREPGRISGAYLRIDPAAYAAFTARLKQTPALMGASFVSLAERSMRTNFNEHMGLMTAIYSSFAAIMAGGVAFSAARVTLAEQERDLATLRVLGFSRLEVSYVLIGEIMVLALLSLPFAVLFGTGMAIWMTHLFSTENFAFPYVFDPAGYAFAISFTLACVLVAALVVRSAVDRLDMVGVLKARD